MLEQPIVWFGARLLGHGGGADRVGQRRENSRFGLRRLQLDVVGSRARRIDAARHLAGSGLGQRKLGAVAVGRRHEGVDQTSRMAGILAVVGQSNIQAAIAIAESNIEVLGVVGFWSEPGEEFVPYGTEGIL